MHSPSGIKRKRFFLCHLKRTDAHNIRPNDTEWPRFGLGFYAGDFSSKAPGAIVLFFASKLRQLVGSLAHVSGGGGAEDGVG